MRAGSVRAEDVNDEDQGIGALDPDLRGTLRAVAVGGRHYQQHPAADALAHKSGVPALDDLPAANLEAGWHAALPAGVENLAGAPDQALILGDKQLALFHHGPGALDEGLGLQRGRRPGCRYADWRGGARRGGSDRWQPGPVDRLRRAVRAGGLLVCAKHIYDEYQGVFAGDGQLAVSLGAEPVLRRDGDQHSAADSAGFQALVKPGDGGSDGQWLRLAGGQGFVLLGCGAVPGVCGEICDGQVTLGQARAVPADQLVHLQRAWRVDVGNRDRWLAAECSG